MRRLCLLFACLLLAAPVQAATYWVNDSIGGGGNDGNACTPSTSALTTTAKKTIQGGIACMASGDTLYIRAGTYTGDSNRITDQGVSIPSGSSGSPTVISAWTGETVTLRPPDNGHADAIHLAESAHSYITLQDLVIDGSLHTINAESVSAIVYLSGSVSHITIQRVEIKSAWYSCVNEYSAGPNLWTEVSAHGCGRRPGDAGSVSGTGAGFYVTANDSIFEHLTIYGNHGYGWYNGGDRNILQYSRIYSNGPLNGAGQFETTIYGVDICAGAYAPCDDNIVRNNLIYNNYGGIQVYSGSDDTEIYHNTIYGNSLRPGDAISVQFAGDMTIRNNIFWGNDTDEVVEYPSNFGTITQDHNLMTDPSFTNAGSGDFTLQATSDAIDAGTTLSSVTDDFTGTTRPQDAGYDIGAYEYDAVPEDTIAVVQRVQNGAAATGATIACPAMTTTTGNALVVLTSWFNTPSSSFVSVTNTGSATWVRAGSELIAGGTRHGIFYAVNITGNAADVITLTVSDAGTIYKDIVCFEVEMMDRTPLLDSDEQSGTGTLATTSPLSIFDAPHALVFGYIVHAAPPITGGSGFTANNHSITGEPTAFWTDEYKIVSENTSADATSAVGDNWQIVGAIFMEDDGVNPPDSPPPGPSIRRWHKRRGQD